jgi:hypothetical protein
MFIFHRKSELKSAMLKKITKMSLLSKIIFYANDFKCFKIHIFLIVMIVTENRGHAGLYAKDVQETVSFKSHSDIWTITSL